jgi:hypothetical protein
MQESLPVIMPYLIEIVGTIVAVVIGAAANAARVKFGIEIEARHREAMHSAIMTGARAALLDGKTPKDAVQAAIAHTFRSTPDAVARLRPSDDVLSRLAEAAVAQAFSRSQDGTQ